MVNEVGAVGRETIIGAAQETSWGTPATPNKFFEITGGDAYKIALRELQSNGWRPTSGSKRQARRGARTSSRGHTATGGLNMELPSNGLGFWLRNILGAPAQSVQLGSSTAYKHTFIAASTRGLGFTLQKVLRQANGDVVSTHTYPGGKVTSAEFACSQGEIATLALETVHQKELMDVAPAVPTYLNDVRLFSWDDAKLSLGNTQIATISSSGLTITNGLNTERDHMGNGGVISEPVDNGDGLGIEGTFTAEYYSQAALYDAYRTRQPLAYEQSFINPDTIGSSSYHESLIFKIPRIILGGDTPTADNPDLITVDVPFSAEWNGVNDTIIVEYISTDVTI